MPVEEIFIPKSVFSFLHFPEVTCLFRLTHPTYYSKYLTFGFKNLFRNIFKKEEVQFFHIRRVILVAFVPCMDLSWYIKTIKYSTSASFITTTLSVSEVDHFLKQWSIFRSLKSRRHSVQFIISGLAILSHPIRNRYKLVLHIRQ